MTCRHWLLVRFTALGTAHCAAAWLAAASAEPPPVAIRVPAEVRVPRAGVTLRGGLFQKAFESNIRYLLQSYSVNDMLWFFRRRAGQQNPPRDRPIGEWETLYEGSVTGRFLMGAGNTLRWSEHPELLRRLDAVIDGIEACRRDDGYLMAYPPEAILTSERGNYARSWVTQGMIEAGYAGNRKAFPLIRGYQDWLNGSDWLPKLLRTSLGYQGMVPMTRLYFTPVGRARDLEVVQRYYQEDYWLDQLAARDERAVWQYPYDRPHAYCITAFEAYLDLYRATGDRRYLEAVQGGWRLIRDRWQHTGGGIAICEGKRYPPGSYYLTPRMHTGELCGSVFWVFLNQRFHQLYPEDERYVAEIEKSIYNIALANQDGPRGMRYHAVLHGRKDLAECNGTCCEGQGTRLYGALPELIYSLADDGVYVNLFEPSEISWSQGGQRLRLAMTTRFPFASEVSLRISAPQPVPLRIRLRIPSWAAGPVRLHLDGRHAATGKPGTYQTLARTWKDNDTISFTLPVRLRATRYAGEDAYPGRQRFAVELGPVLLAAVGPLEAMSPSAPPLPNDLATAVTYKKSSVFDDHGIVLHRRASELGTWLQPLPGRPLHFAVVGDGRYEFLPYWEVAGELFTTAPVMEN